MGHKIKESEVPVGTWGNKYDSKNPIKNYLLKNFLGKLTDSIKSVSKDIKDISEIGCGEGHLTRLISEHFPSHMIYASDYSKQIVEYAKKHNKSKNIEYSIENIYEINKLKSADILVCCEVLEHLDDPEKALENLSKLKSKFVLLSVPLEPWWRVVQFLSGNHLKYFGNTPGHVNHWSHKEFKNLVTKYFEISEASVQFPWSVILCKPKLNK